MRFLICLSLSTILFKSVKGQVIPDLTTGDHYRPYITENQKRENIIQSTPQLKNNLGEVKNVFENLA
jgi:hypothetical protein